MFLYGVTVTVNVGVTCHDGVCEWRRDVSCYCQGMMCVCVCQCLVGLAPFCV